ncbi:MAG: bacillithiol system redox-active protein YtxJ [Ferruginibacter sp.]
MNWKLLTTEDQLQQIKQASGQMPQVIFKHSTRCSISSVAKSRLERAQPPDQVDFYYLDLIKYRNISNKIEDEFMVNHESPQVLIINKGECIYEESHNGISMDDIAQQIKKI